MRPVFVLLLGVMMLAASFVRAAVAQDAAVGVATYIEVMSQSMAAAVTSLRTEARMCRCSARSAGTTGLSFWKAGKTRARRLAIPIVARGAGSRH